jgi:hypothetical protein
MNDTEDHRSLAAEGLLWFSRLPPSGAAFVYGRFQNELTGKELSVANVRFHRHIRSQKSFYSCGDTERECVAAIVRYSDKDILILACNDTFVNLSQIMNTNGSQHTVLNKTLETQVSRKPPPKPPTVTLL